jgi:hypothetical protein
MQISNFLTWNEIHREDRKRINLAAIIKMYSINWTEIRLNQTEKWDYLGKKKLSLLQIADWLNGV